MCSGVNGNCLFTCASYPHLAQGELPPHLVRGLSEEGKYEEVCCLSAGCYVWALLNKTSFVNIIQDKSGMLLLFVNMEL